MRIPSLYWTLAALVCATVAVLSNLYATSLYGLALSPDSASYLRATQSLHSGTGIPPWYLAWPPMYPALVSVFEWLPGLRTPAQAARVYGALSQGLVVLAAAWILRRQKLRSPALILAGCAAVVVCGPLFNVAIWAWSETSFILFSLLALGLLDKALESPSPGQSQRQSLALLIAAATLSAAAFMCRYVGFTLVGAGVLAILLSAAPPKRRLLRAALFAVLACLPNSIWFLRNLALSGSASGVREASAMPMFLPQLALTLDSTLSWPGLRLALAAAVAGAVLWKVRRAREASGPQLAAAGAAVPMRPLILFALVFPASLALLASLIHFDSIDERLAAPAVLPLFLYALAWCDRLLEILRENAPKLVDALALAFAALIIASSAPKLIDTAQKCAVNGAGGYNLRYWREHPLIQYLAELPADQPIESNAPDVLYLMLNHEAQATPSRLKGETNLERLRGRWPQQGPVLVAWFAAVGRPYLIGLPELSRVADVQLVQQFPDAVLVQASAQSPPSTDTPRATEKAAGDAQRR